MSTLIRVPVKLTNMVRQHMHARVKIEDFLFPELTSKMTSLDKPPKTLEEMEMGGAGVT